MMVNSPDHTLYWKRNNHW